MSHYWGNTLMRVLINAPCITRSFHSAAVRLCVSGDSSSYFIFQWFFPWSWVVSSPYMSRWIPSWRHKGTLLKTSGSLSCAALCYFFSISFNCFGLPTLWSVSLQHTTVLHGLLSSVCKLFVFIYFVQFSSGLIWFLLLHHGWKQKLLIHIWDVRLNLQWPLKCWFFSLLKSRVAYIYLPEVSKESVYKRIPFLNVVVSRSI